MPLYLSNVRDAVMIRPRDDKDSELHGAPTQPRCVATRSESHISAALSSIFIGKEHSVCCRMIVNFSQNIRSKSLKISHPIFDFTKEVRQSTPLEPSWDQRLNWHHFDGFTRMKINMLRGSPVAQR
jgi:hypothetical protein